MRPRYHYAPAANWLSDPNGLVYQDGQWHLFYQYNPQGEDWGHMAWGHATSVDLAQWVEHQPALVEEDGMMIFSGSAVVDAANSAGFGADALVAIYTGADIEAQRQTQCLAFSTDGGKAWTKFVGNPVLDLGMADFRDPNVIWHEATGKWVMTVVRSAENCAVIYTSPNLQDWTERSRIVTDGAPGHLWECPLLIELPVEGADASRWLFKVDVLSGAPGSGALYRTGWFDGTDFVPDGPWRVVDHGADFYAAIAWHNPRDAAGRPAWIGWMGNHAVQAHLPLQGWRGAMSLPRRLSFVQAHDGLGHVLRQQIEPAVAAKFGESLPLALGADAQSLPLTVRVDLPALASMSLTIADGAGSTLQLTRSMGVITLARHDVATAALAALCQAPVPDTATLTLWLDAGSLEVLDDAGLSALTVQHRLVGPIVDWQSDRPFTVQVSAYSA